MQPQGRSRRCLVVGAGPAGLASALAWRKRGWEVTVLDRRTSVGPKICGECLSPPARDALRRLGVWERFRPGQVRNVRSIAIVGRTGRRCELRYDGDFPFTVSRAVLDSALESTALASGVEIRRGWTALFRDVRADGVVIRCANQDKERLELEGEFLIAADGRGSPLARAAGLARARRPWPRHAALLGRFELEPGVDAWPDEVRMTLAPWGYVGVNAVPDANGRRELNVIAVIPESGLRRRWAEKVGPKGIDALWLSLVQGAEAPEPLARVTRRLQVASGRVLSVSPMAWSPKRLTASRFALVGDGAGFVDPFTGEGLHHAFASAERLADLVADGDAKSWPAGLAEYERWHRRVFGPEEAFCRRLQILLRVPALAELVIARLSAKPELARRLALAVADRLPTREVLALGYWARVLWPLSSRVEPPIEPEKSAPPKEAPA